MNDQLQVASGTIEFPMKLYGISLKMLEIEITAKAEIEFFKSEQVVISRVHPIPLCILFSNTKEIQWVDTDATLVITYMYKEPLEYNR